jgi:hypothetical protein
LWRDGISVYLVVGEFHCDNYLCGGLFEFFDILFVVLKVKWIFLLLGDEGDSRIAGWPKLILVSINGVLGSYYKISYFEVRIFQIFS